MASLENKCNTKYDALADTIRQLLEDGLATSSDSASDANFGTGGVSEASDGDDKRLQEALASIEAAQTTFGSLQKELESLISKLDDKPSLDQVKALLGSSNQATRIALRPTRPCNWRLVTSTRA